MTAWLLSLLATAHAGVLHLTLERDDDGVRAVSAVVEDRRTPTRPLLRQALAPDVLTVVDADGTVLASLPAPSWTETRDLPLPEGGALTAVIDLSTQRLVLPWPEGAFDVALRGEPLGITPRRGPLREGDVVRVHGEADQARALDLLLVAEGYTAGRRDAFLDDADQVARHLRSIDPWGPYRRLFNIHAAFTPSTSAGIDPTPSSDSADTPFSCHYGCAGLDRLICCDEGDVLAFVDEVFPEADGILLLIDDEQYGGSGGFTFSTAYNGGYLDQVSAHELGHTLVGLWDEYDYGFTDTRNTPAGPNCAPPDADPLPWSDWVGDEGVGAFPVCSFTDWVRPTDDGCMMASLQDRYCAVCREFVVRSLYEARGEGPLESVTPAPAGGPWVLTAEQPGEVDLDAISPERFTTFTWTLDGEVLDETGPSLALGCPKGASQLSVEVTDATPWLRDTSGLTLSQTVSWELDTTACPDAPPPEPERRCGCSGTGRSGALPAALLVVLGLIRRRQRPGA